MRRALLPVVLAASVSLSMAGCSKSAVPAQVSQPAPVTQPSAGEVATSPTPQNPGTPSDPAAPGAPADQSATAPGQTPPAGGQTAGQNPPVKVDPKPLIKWYPPSIGMPLKSDDPAAAGKKVVALTFDDGPSDTGTTASILDTLAKENVKAMFFITGYGAKHIDLVKREFAEGHILAPHTETHPDLTTLTTQQVRDEITPVYQLITQVTGQKPAWFRPPFGSYNKSVLNLLTDEYNMQVLNWSDGSLDWDGTKDGYKDPQKVIDETMKQIHPGAVVLMHDTLKHTAEALPGLIHALRDAGYEFVQPSLPATINADRLK